MRHANTNYLIVGVFVVAVLIGLIVSVGLLTGRTGPTDSYHAVFDNVTGVKYGTQVLFEGFPVGQVEEVSPFKQEGKLTFRVDMSIQEGWHIPDDSIAHIQASALLAATTINIEAGSSSAFYAPGSRIASAEADNIFATVNSVAEDVGDLIGQMRTLITRLNEQAPTITDNLAAFSLKMNESGSRMQEILRPENIKRMDSALARLDDGLGDFAALSHELKNTRLQLDRLLGNTNALVQDNRDDFRQTVGNLKHIMAELSRRIDAIAYNLETTSRHMNEFSRQIRANPGLLLSSTPPAEGARE